MKGNITYIDIGIDIDIENDQREGLQCVCYQNCRQSYPTHTHAAHIVIGFVVEGAVCVVIDGQQTVHRAGSLFCIPPDTAHGIETLDNAAYTMLSVCIPVKQLSVEDAYGNADRDQKNTIRQLKQTISDAPENTFSVEQMAAHICVSPYHMIRQFRAVCGLTPHQFQIQCRVRKAQRLLGEGRSVTETAYAAGFCDQSHFDRCFGKIVRLTPKEYQKCLRKQSVSTAPE